MDGIRTWIEAEGTGHWFFLAFPIVLLCLFIWFKGRRTRLLIPSLLICIIIINPWFYRAWDKLGLYAYWRILWIVPVIPVVACVAPSMTERIKKSWIKMTIVAMSIGAIIVGGTFLYNGAGGSFVKMVNVAKLPNVVVQIAERLLELDEYPRVIVQDPFGVYIRQYSGSIDTLFGRDLHGYITGGVNKEVAIIRNDLNNQEKDLNEVRQFMINDNYGFLVTTRESEEGFECLESVDGFCIYRAVGNPTIIKTRNEKGQITSITTVDDKGRPLDNAAGFATISYSYDDNGFINHKSWITASGKQYMQPAGYYELSEEYDRKGSLLKRSYLNSKGMENNRLDGFSRAEWKKHDVEKVILLDREGSPIDITGINLVKDADETWTEWMSPDYDSVNSCIVIDTMVLGEKNPGDFYSCQVELEFRDVAVTDGQPFLFQTQGSVDGGWKTRNVWGLFVVLKESPTDGVYQYNMTCQLDEDMANANRFEIGFRCDNWADGAFRIRRLKIEKNSQPSEWTQGL